MHHTGLLMSGLLTSVLNLGNICDPYRSCRSQTKALWRLEVSQELLQRRRSQMLQLNQHHLQVCAACCYTDPLWLLIDMHHYRAYLTWNFLKTQVGVLCVFRSQTRTRKNWNGTDQHSRHTAKSAGNFTGEAAKQMNRSFCHRTYSNKRSPSQQIIFESLWRQVLAVPSNRHRKDRMSQAQLHQ